MLLSFSVATLFRHAAKIPVQGEKHQQSADDGQCDMGPGDMQPGEYNNKGRKDESAKTEFHLALLVLG